MYHGRKLKDYYKNKEKKFLVINNKTQELIAERQSINAAMKIASLARDYVIINNPNY